jgi:RimJ/RimL family protein N-acetyltransferase
MYRWVVLGPAVMRALVEGRLEEASVLAGEVGVPVPLTEFLVDEAWLWRIRLEQVAADPEAQGWVARAAWCQDGPDAGKVVGHLGFHGPPNEDRRVEVAYSVDPAYRRRGHARAMLTQVLAEVDSMPEVAVVRASISPDNTGSLATIRGLGFAKVGEQWDEDDGLEELWERPSPVPTEPTPATMSPWGPRSR